MGPHEQEVFLSQRRTMVDCIGLGAYEQLQRTALISVALDWTNIDTWLTRIDHQIVRAWTLQGAS